jgi:large subunit ribosomal protein L6
MSRIGKLPVPLAPGVEVKVTDGTVRVKGPKGELATPLVSNVRIEIGDGQAQVHREGDDKPARARHGLMRSLLNNMVTGVTTGFTRELEIVGVGYRAEARGKVLVLSVGYSHPVEMAVPEGLEVKMDGVTKIAISGVDKQRVGQFAAEVRKVRPPEPYKGKGIRYAGEQVRRKVGKAAVGA